MEFRTTIAALAVAACITSPLHAAVSEQEAARLGKDLTLTGAEQAGNADGNKIEDAITRLTGGSSEMVTRTNEIVDKFYEFSDVFQVGVSELVKNPFEVEVVPKEIKDEVAMAQDDAEKQRLIREQKIKKKAESLKLLSVLRSEDSDACMINDQILHKGDMLEGFQVTEIGAASVLLTWRGDGAGQSVGTDDLTILLKLAQ